MHPHATQSLVQEQSAARICLELQPLRLTAQQRLIDTDERLEQAAMQTASGRRVTPATPSSIAAGAWQNQNTHRVRDASLDEWKVQHREVAYRKAAIAHERTRKFEETSKRRRPKDLKLKRRRSEDEDSECQGEPKRSTAEPAKLTS